MIHGLDKFREYFQDFKDNYVIIGGLASYLLLDDAGFDMARATKDIDLVLSVEALTDTFISQFWKFVKAGGYTCIRKSTGKRRFYRFTERLLFVFNTFKAPSCCCPILTGSVDAMITPSMFMKLIS